MFEFLPIDERYANRLLKIKEDEGYAVYDLDHHLTDLDNLLNNDEYKFFVATGDDGEMIGFVECTFDDDEILEVGCGLLREFMGHGYGFDFISECMDYLIEYFDYGKTHILTYLKPGDKKTIKIFERVGYRVTDEAEDWTELTLDL
jgi:[ribosomal protein S18]-alanine N-acetyltransferase